MNSGSKIGLALIAALIIGLVVYAFWPRKDEKEVDEAAEGNEVVTTSTTTYVDRQVSTNIGSSKGEMSSAEEELVSASISYNLPSVSTEMQSASNSQFMPPTNIS